MNLVVNKPNEIERNLYIDYDVPEAEEIESFSSKLDTIVKLFGDYENTSPKLINSFLHTSRLDQINKADHIFVYGTFTGHLTKEEQLFINNNKEFTIIPLKSHKGMRV